jgi:diguanylate cyclase (GGDEF)-like protein/PAS domain S-box-containing protein
MSHSNPTHLNSGTQLVDVLEHSADTIVKLAVDGTVLCITASATALFGHAPEVLVGADLASFVYPDDRVRLKNSLRLLNLGREQRPCTYRTRHKDGRFIWTEATFRPIPNSGLGDSCELVGIMRDITWRIHPDNSLASRDMLAEILVDSVVDYAIYLLDLDGNVRTWNQGARRIKGYTAQEVIGSNFSLFYTDDDVRAGEPARSLERARAMGTFEAEGWRVRKDGTRLWASVVIDAVRNPAGEVVGFAKVTRDITKRTALVGIEHPLTKQQRVDGDIDDPPTSRNAGAQSLTGYRLEEIIGRYFSSFFTADKINSGGSGRPLEWTRTQRDSQLIEARYRGLLESVPDAIAIVNDIGQIVFTNVQTQTLFGYAQAELLGLAIEDLLPQRYRGMHSAHRSDYLMRPRARAMGSQRELYGLRKDGIEFPVEISLSPLQIDAGTLVMCAIRDVTDRKRADQKFRDLLEAAPDAMVIVDHDGRIVHANSQTDRLFGYTRQELLGLRVEVLMPEQFRDRHAGHRNLFFSRPHLRPMGAGFELRGQRKDGTEFPIEISLSPLETEHGLLVTGSIRDISERKDAEQERERAITRMSVATGSARVGIWECQIEAQALFWDPIMFALYGVDEAQFVPSYESWIALLHADDRARVAQELESAVSGTAPYDTEFLTVWPNGEIRYIHATATVLRKAGVAVRVIGTNWDITEVRMLAEQLRTEKDAATYAAMHDKLTGLLNRRGLEEWIQAHSGLSATLVYLDIDDFKAINDRGGHAAGDEILRRVAGIINHAIRSQDGAARIGGDEFIIVLPDLARAETIRVLKRITAALLKLRPLGSEDRTRIRMSNGVSMFAGAAAFSDALREADAELYRHKRRRSVAVSVSSHRSDAAFADRRTTASR